MGGFGSVIVTFLVDVGSTAGAGGGGGGGDCKGHGTDEGKGHGTEDDEEIFLASVLGFGGAAYGFGSKAGCEDSADKGFGTAPIVAAAAVAPGTGPVVVEVVLLPDVDMNDV